MPFWNGANPLCRLLCSAGIGVAIAACAPAQHPGTGEQARLAALIGQLSDG